MTTPENWDDLLKDVDFAGVGDPSKFINMIYVDKDASPEQNQVHDLTRGLLIPFEAYYHQQVEDIAGTVTPSRGIKRNWRGRYNFTITTPGGLHIPVEFHPQRENQTWSAKYFKVDNTQIYFDPNGRIVKVKLNSFSHLPEVRKFKAHFYKKDVPGVSGNDGVSMHFTIKDPTHMELYGGGNLPRKVGKNGTLEGYDSKNIFINAFRLAMQATDPRNN